MPDTFISTPTSSEVRANQISIRTTRDEEYVRIGTVVIIDRFVLDTYQDGSKKVKVIEPTAKNVLSVVNNTYTTENGVTFTGAELALMLEAFVDFHKADP